MLASEPETSCSVDLNLKEEVIHPCHGRIYESLYIQVIRLGVG